MQIVAQGAQDKYLTVDPEITFFKSMHRRHTNFAVESIEQTFNGHVTSGGKVSATISRNGDLVSRMWLEFDTDTPGFGADATTAYDMIDNVSLEIGGTRVDRHYGEWMEISDDLRCEPGKRDGLNTCVKTAGAKKVRVPLSFWFCKDAGQALPLIALQYHEVKLNVEFKTLPSDAKVSLWVDYIYLDTAERQRFARSAHEYLIEQVQTTGQETLGNGSNKIRLNFNHPVKELVWTATMDKYASGAWSSGVPALKSAKLQLNGHDRFAERDATYFKEVQQFQHHTGAANAYVYSFALEPEKLQPSGTCNFSRIDNASLQLEAENTANGDTSANPPPEATTKNGKAEVYAVNYNVLRIKNGMGGLAYSN